MSESFKSLEEIRVNVANIVVNCVIDSRVHLALKNMFDRLTATLQTHELREKVSWRKYLDLDETIDGSFNIFVRESGKILGDIYREVDGYYVFSATPNGCLNSNALKMIAEILDEKNKEWDEQVRKDLSDDGMTGEA